MEKDKEHKLKTHRKKYAHIPLSILVFIAWRNLVSKKLRTGLTMFGVIVGISAIFFLLSFSLGLQNLVTTEIIGNESIKTVEVGTPNSRIVKLNQENIDKIKGLPHVQRLSAIYSLPGSLKQQGGERDAVVYGVDSQYQEMTELNLVDGRLLNQEDNRSMFINTSALEAVGAKTSQEAIGKKVGVFIPLAGAKNVKSSINEEFTIVGVIDSGSGSEIFIPGFILANAGVPVYSQVKLNTDTNESITGLRQQIESLGYETSSPNDTIDEINQIFRVFNMVLLGFGTIGMVIAVLGMFNTLTISLLERTKEIGLMMALGGRNRDMSKLFILEAVLLSITGALVGILLAFSTGKIVTVFVNNFAHRRGVDGNIDMFSTPIWLVLATVAFMVVVGLLVAFFPAKRARKINPIDALRHE